jgi:ABC-type transport system substrate-binding protein
MNTKRILIYLPLGLILFLAQSFFWVPTYDKQAVGNPNRLVKYIHGAGADAHILNPILSADSASSTINNLVFDGLIDLDDNLDYRPRLASSWVQYEEAYLVVPSHMQGRKIPSDANKFSDWIRKALQANIVWSKNLKSVEVVAGEKITGQVSVPVLDEEGRPVMEKGRPKTRKVDYSFQQPDRIKFTLHQIDQDFFKPIKKILGEEFFQSFPYAKYIHASDSADQKIFPLTEHNPVIVFNLRKGVRFHDGHEFDSGDVLFTYQAIMNSKNASPRTSDYEPIKSVEPLETHKIKIVYKRLFSSAIFSWGMGILPEHLLNDAAMKKEAEEKGVAAETFSIRDSQFNRHPVGTGSFVFKEWQSDELIRLVSNKDYWESPAEYEEYVMRILPDPLTQEMEFYAGAVDNYSSLPHQIKRLKKDKKYQNFSSVGMSYSYIGYNLRKPLFKSAEVRRALGMAIDVEKIIKYLLYGEGERVTGPYAKITDWYDHSIQPLPYDPEGALKILNDLGWKKNEDGFLEKDGKLFEFNLITNSGNPVRKNIMTIAQNSWQKLGIKCNTQIFEWAVFLKDFVNSLKFDALILGWGTGVDPDMFQIWHSSQAGPQQLNFVGYENSDVDRLIVRIRREYDKKNQIEMTHKLHKLIAKDQPYTFLFVKKSTQLLDKKIVIVDRQPDDTEKYSKIYPTKDGSIRFYFNKWKKLPQVPEFAAGG